MIRVDDGTPWGSTGDLAADLAPWLIGLAIDPWWNPPRRPPDGGAVERSRGTGKRWGDPESCDSAEQLQRRMDEHDEMQGATYPYREEEGRTQWWRGPTHGGRDYDPGQEEANWELRRVAAFLGDRCVSRRVDQKGRISIYDRNPCVGKMNGQKEVQVILADEPSRWVVADEKGTTLGELAAPEVSAERIMALEVTNRRPGRGSDATPKRPDPPRTHCKTSCRDRRQDLMSRDSSARPRPHPPLPCREVIIRLILTRVESAREGRSIRGEEAGFSPPTSRPSIRLPLS